MKSKILALSTIIILSSCYSDNQEFVQQESIQYDGVDRSLWSFFSRFEEEAQLRGLSYDLNDLGITGVIESIPEDGVAGTCEYGRHIHHVTVDRNFWNRSSEVSREFVVFHELGHCVLGRGHEEGTFANGLCLSIMRSGLGDCRDGYNNSNREYYLDELFDIID